MFDKREFAYYNNTRVIARCTMRFSVRSIINTPGGELPFAFSMDLSDLDFGGSRPIAEPVEVTGGVRNRLDVLELTLQAKTTLHCVCDRCAKPFLQEKEVQWQCVLATEKQNEDNDDIVLLEEGEFVDLEDLARTAFLLEMDTKMLCSQDCKGLCPRCGADLNLGPCSCKRELAPRMAILATLLENDPNE